jgi:hypothetical protein
MSTCGLNAQNAMGIAAMVGNQNHGLSFQFHCQSKISPDVLL